MLNRARTRVAREGRMVSLAADDEEPDSERNRFKPDGHWEQAPRLWDVLDPERIVAGQQLWQHVRAAIATLPPGQQAVVILRDVEGQSAEDACRLCRSVRRTNASYYIAPVTGSGAASTR